MYSLVNSTFVAGEIFQEEIRSHLYAFKKNIQGKRCFIRCLRIELYEQLTNIFFSVL